MRQSYRSHYSSLVVRRYRDTETSETLYAIINSPAHFRAEADAYSYQRYALEVCGRRQQMAPRTAMVGGLVLQAALAAEPMAAQWTRDGVVTLP